MVCNLEEKVLMISLQVMYFYKILLLSPAFVFYAYLAFKHFDKFFSLFIEPSDSINARYNARTLARFAACMISELDNTTFDDYQGKSPNFQLRIG